MLKKMFIVSKRKLTVKEVAITRDTFIKACDIGGFIFLDKPSADEKLRVIIALKQVKNIRGAK